MNIASLMDLPAVIAPELPVLTDASRTVDYAELRRRAGARSEQLRMLGIDRGHRVGLLATNRIDAVEYLFASALLGATFVPLNFRAARDECAYLLTASEVSVVITEERYRTIVEEVRPATLSHLIMVGDAGPADAARPADVASAAEEIADVDDSDLAVLMYTSGTTSRPKGVMLTHGALSGYVMGANDCCDGTPNGRMLLAAPLNHVAGLTSLLNAVYAGRETVLLPQFAPAAWLESVERYEITHAFLVPTMLARVIDDSTFDRRDLRSLRALTYGAAPMPPSLVRRALSLFPDTVEFTGSYGQTETTATLCVLGPADHRLTGDEAEVRSREQRLSSVGRPVDDVEIRIVDRTGRALSPGRTGEVQVRTARAMVGYLGETENRGRDGWLATGDLGYCDADGYLFLTGRANDVIIRGGENVSPAEVEAVLLEHPSVSEAGVVGLPSEEWGERVVAVVTARGQLTEDELLEYCRRRLAPFKRPERVRIVAELPTNTGGKVVRRLLRQLFDPIDA
jgi:acyl-CoA synthetase (AMP-forming)/AMP-acid ligase II